MRTTTDESQQYAEVSVAVEAPDAKPQQPSVAKPGKLPEKVAVLICHGMGQQVQFETLDSVTREVRDAAESCGTLVTPKPDIAVSLHPDADRFVGRAELKLKGPDGSPVEVHFYEAYWAPITEGRVTLRETLSFFVDAARRGLRFAYQEGVFDRWMFGGREEFEIPARRVLQLGLGMWILLLITAAFAAIALIPLLGFVDLFRGGQADPQLAITIALAFSILACLVMLAVLTAIVGWILRPRADTKRPKAVIDAPLGILAPRKWKRVVMVLAVESIMLLTTLFGVWVGIKMYEQWLLPVVNNPASHPVSLIFATLLFVAEFLLLRQFVQGFLIEFAGDVAAYVSPYKVSKFEEIRRDIQERGRRIARFIYSARAADSIDPLYDAVFVVGHSLGSVIAYDTLNDAINRDTLANGWGSAATYGVVDRTKLLLTFGSPLDKTAFVFRTQKPNREFDVREALAASVQPLILSYANRNAHWLNLWSRSDWISGPIGYYDAPQPPPGKGVCNIENAGSHFPGTAHTDYWTGQLFRGVLHAALTGVCPDDVPEPQRSQVLGALA